MSRLKVLIPLLLLGIMQSCISNKKMVYLQDKTESKPQHAEQNKTFEVLTSTYKVEKQDVLYVEINYQSIGAEQELNKSTIGERESRVAFAQHPYTSGYQVSDSGSIELKEIGTIDVLGKSINEIRAIIAKKSGSYYLNPTVKVYLMNAYFTVMGEVNRPGRYQFLDQMNVLEAVGQAGDLGEFADRESIKILRLIDDKYSIYHLDLTDELVINSTNFNVLPGDIIMVKPQVRKKFAGRNIQWALSGLSIIVSIIAVVTR